jgi:hypothetical protein
VQASVGTVLIGVLAEPSTLLKKFKHKGPDVLNIFKHNALL